MMSEHSSRSRELLLVSILGVLAGGAVTTLLMSKEGKKLKDHVDDNYQHVRKKISGVLSTLKTTLEKNVDGKTDEWFEKVKETLDHVKKQIDSTDLFEPNDMSMVILSFTLIGALLGIGSTLMLQEAYAPKEEDFFQNITSRFSSIWPLLAELRPLIDSKTKNNAREHIAPRKEGKGDDLIEFAILGLKLWDRIKHRSQ